MLSDAPYHIRFFVTLLLAIIFTALLVGIARWKRVKGIEKRMKGYQIAAALLERLCRSRKNSGTPTAAPLPKQTSCRLVKLKRTLVFTAFKSFGTGT